LSHPSGPKVRTESSLCSPAWPFVPRRASLHPASFDDRLLVEAPLAHPAVTVPTHADPEGSVSVILGEIHLRGTHYTELRKCTDSKRVHPWSEFLRGDGPPVLLKQRVAAIKPGLNRLHQQEVGHGKKRDRAQQRQRQRDKSQQAPERRVRQHNGDGNDD